MAEGKKYIPLAHRALVGKTVTDVEVTTDYMKLTMDDGSIVTFESSIGTCVTTNPTKPAPMFMEVDEGEGRAKLG